MKKNGVWQSGFAVFELIALIFLLCVFLCGLVYLTADATGTDAKGKDLSVDVEGERVLDDLGAIFDQARGFVVKTDSGGALDLEEDGSNIVVSSLVGPKRLSPGQVMVLADLDGDRKTGLVEASSFLGEGGDGIERLEVVYIRAEDKALAVDVLTGQNGEGREVVLSEYLDAGSKVPFSITCFYEGHEVSADSQDGGKVEVENLLVDEIRVAFALERDGESKTFDNAYDLAEPLPCIVF